jgi:SAM-dependent methyltransferase
MLNVINDSSKNMASLLDVGCGYGGLQSYALSKNIELEYTGIDVAENMIDWAATNLPAGKFIQGDILDYRFAGKFDYVVCNGILTQKLETPGLEMDQFAARLIRQMFSLCNIGIAFNTMTTKVNYYSNNLYYRNPAEMLSWCLSEITPHVRLDHAYPLYEYTTYLYRDPLQK